MDYPTDFEQKNRKRSHRRSSVLRMKDKAYKLAKYLGWNKMWALKNAEHLKSCSCWMCRNQRDIYGAPISEIKQSMKGKDVE